MLFKARKWQVKCVSLKNASFLNFKEFWRAEKYFDFHELWERYQEINLKSFSKPQIDQFLRRRLQQAFKEHLLLFCDLYFDNNLYLGKEEGEDISIQCLGLFYFIYCLYKTQRNEPKEKILLPFWIYFEIFSDKFIEKLKLYSERISDEFEEKLNEIHIYFTFGMKIEKEFLKYKASSSSSSKKEEEEENKKVRLTIRELFVDKIIEDKEEKKLIENEDKKISIEERIENIFG